MDWKTNENIALNWKVDKITAEPSLYQVILLNDDYTTKEFVIEILMAIFHKNETEAVNLMEKVHQSGSAVVGIYVYDIAATKVSITLQNARQRGFPLQCKIEKC